MARRSKSPKIPRNAVELDTGFTQDGLLAELEEFAEEGGLKLRNNVLSHLKAQLEGAMDYTRKRFDHGRLDGLETARMIASIHDKVITALWSFASRHIVVAENPTDAERISLCAVGGLVVGKWRRNRMWIFCF